MAIKLNGDVDMDFFFQRVLHYSPFFIWRQKFLHFLPVEIFPP